VIRAVASLAIERLGNALQDEIIRYNC